MSAPSWASVVMKRSILPCASLRRRLCSLLTFERGSPGQLLRHSRCHSLKPLCGPDHHLKVTDLIFGIQLDDIDSFYHEWTDMRAKFENHLMVVVKLPERGKI